MRKLPDSGPIWTAWNNGAFLVGAAQRPHTRVTVEPGYFLNSAYTAGSYTKVPIRWWQRADNSQVEIEVPGVISVDIDRSIDKDAATCNIKLMNQKMNVPTQGSSSTTEFENPGYLTPDRGSASNRWSYAANEWANVLTINACIRTYQGYGGHGKTIAQAITDGNLILTGVWLVDDVLISNGGQMQLSCRDMAKLLIEQQSYPPFMPYGQKLPNGNTAANLYPLSYSRFYYREVDTPIEVYGTQAVNPLFKIYGIEPTMNGKGYWLVGDDGGVFTYGDNYFYGSLGVAGSGPLLVPTGLLFVQGIARTSTSNGYWVGRSDGAVYSFGDAKYKGGLGSGGNPKATSPIIAIESGPWVDGYWLCSTKGEVYSFGSAPYLGGSPPLVGGASITCMAATSTGAGYWLADTAGHVYAYGDAQYYGGITGPLNGPITGITRTPTNAGYYLVGTDGGVFTYGDAKFFGSVANTKVPYVIYDGIVTAGSNSVSTVLSDFLPTDVNASISGDGFAATTVQAVNSATNIGIGVLATANVNPAQITIQRQIVLNDPVCDIAVSIDPLSGKLIGYWIAAEDGGVFTYGTAQFYGSLPGATANQYPYDGNYKDYVDIIKDLVLWGGWYLNDNGATANVYGNLESTGIYATDQTIGGGGRGTPGVDATIFDKKPIIDAIHKIKEVVGYLFYVDDEGAVHFHEANYWQSGNFLPSGTHTNVIPVVDERVQLTSYQRSTPDRDIRSQIIIGTNEPYGATPGAVVGNQATNQGPTQGIVTVYTPSNVNLLKGMIKPAMWINQVFADPNEQLIMAELIALHIYFKSRLGSVKCMANPMVQIDDQVQILERETFELNTHYVRGIKTSHNLKTGEYTMDLTTNLLSPPGSWAVVKPQGSPGTGTIIANRHV